MFQLNKRKQTATATPIELKEPVINEVELNEVELKEPELNEVELNESELKEPELKEPELEEPVVTTNKQNTDRVFTMPFDNIARYTDVWDSCKKVLNLFKNHRDIKGTNLTVKDSADVGKFALLNNGATISDMSSLSATDVAQLMNFFRYKDLVEQTSKKTFINVLDFFNELEANREYHARACIVLCSADSSKLLDITNLKVSDLDPLDRIVYGMNKVSVFTPYELTFVLNHCMVFLAEWEKEWLGATLYKKEYLEVLQNPDLAKELPSHLRLLGRIAGKKASEMYPQSLLMNYSMFYPITLYPTGRAPQ